MSIKENVLNVIQENREDLLKLSDTLFENPEIGLQEFESSKKIAAFLRSKGFEVEENLAGMETAFKATKKNGNGPRVVFIAEYDALAEIGHACGHHMIATMSVGAAIGLAEVLKDMEGEVSIVGTPSEETGHGKPYLIEHHVFDGYDVAMMVHPNSNTELYEDVLAIGGIDFTFVGKPAHAGASPYEGINALDAVVLLYNNINALRQQLKDGTRIHGIILEAGTAANVIPDKGKVRLEFRAREQKYFDEVVEKAVNCAKAAALATGCKLEYEHFEPTCQGMKHNKTLGEYFRKIMGEYGIEEGEKGGPISTDMGNLSQLMPCIHPLFQVSNHNEFLHTTEFMAATREPLALSRMIEASEILALVGLELFENKEFLQKAKEEFNAPPMHL